MVDYNKIGEYLATMVNSANETVETGDFALQQLFGRYGCIAEETLHKDFEYAIAKHKMEIETNQYLSSEQKENNIDLFLKSSEEYLKEQLKCQGRLL